MAHYLQVGSIPPKRHTQHHAEDGSLYYEELMGEEGFSSDSSLLYHRHIPSAFLGADPWDLGDQSLVPNHPLQPVHLRLRPLFDAEAWRDRDAVEDHVLVLGNADVRISYAEAGRASALYRNAVGDECVYVESGAARVETVFGVLEVTEGDYVMIPRATTHRWVPEGDAALHLYIVEANSHIGPPHRFLSRFGQLLEHAPYCERDFRVPTGPLLSEGEEVVLLVKHRLPGGSGIGGTQQVLPSPAAVAAALETVVRVDARLKLTAGLHRAAPYADITGSHHGFANILVALPSWSPGRTREKPCGRWRRRITLPSPRSCNGTACPGGCGRSVRAACTSPSPPAPHWGSSPPSPSPPLSCPGRGSR